MAATTKTATTKYDSKNGNGGVSNFLKVTLLVETGKGRYSKSPITAKQFGESLDDYFSEYQYDGKYPRYRILAETLSEKAFEEAYNA